MVAGAFNEPGSADNPGTGEGDTTIWKGKEKSSHVTLFNVLRAVLLKNVVEARAIVGV